MSFTFSQFLCYPFDDSPILQALLLRGYPPPLSKWCDNPLSSVLGHIQLQETRPFFDFPTFRHVPGSVIGLATAPVPPPATHPGRRSISAESGGQLVTNSFSWSGLKLKDSNQGFIFANPAGMIQNNSWFSSKSGWKSSLILKNGIKLSIVLHIYNSFFFWQIPFHDGARLLQGNNLRMQPWIQLLGCIPLTTQPRHQQEKDET